MNGWEDVGVPDVPLHLPGVAGLEPGDGGGDGLLLDLGDETYGLPSSHVLPVEAVTLTDETGMTICTDTDGDGRVDALSVVRFDGGWSSWRRVESMAGGVGEGDGTVSSVTEIRSGTGEGTFAGGGHRPAHYGGELGRPAARREGIPPVTPENGRGAWDARGWECVDRGNWG